MRPACLPDDDGRRALLLLLLLLLLRSSVLVDPPLSSVPATAPPGGQQFQHVLIFFRENLSRKSVWETVSFCAPKMLSMMSVEALLQEVARENFGSSNSASPSEFGGDSSMGFFSVKRELQRRRQLKMVG